MSNKPLKSIKFPDLADTYVVSPGSNLAPNYSSSSTYAVGDLVTYDEILYECATAITAAEAWDSTKWTAVSVADIIESVKEDISALGLSVVDGALNVTYAE